MAKIKVSLEKFALAKQQAGLDSSKEDIAKFYLDPALAKHIAKNCSIDLFRYLHDKSQDPHEFVHNAPELEDFGLDPNSFKKTSKNLSTSSFLGGFGGLLLFAWSATFHPDLSFVKGLILGILGPGLLLIFPLSSFAKQIFLLFSPQVKKCISFAKSIRAYEQNTLSYWKSLSWREFEIEISRFFARMGFRSRVTKATGDRGIDVILYDESRRRILVQCKQYNRPIGPAIVREMLGTLVNEKAEFGIIVGLSGFTQGAYDTASGSIMLLEVKDLINLRADDLRAKVSLQIKFDFPDN